MKNARQKTFPRPTPSAKLVELRARLAESEEALRARLAESEEALRAIRSGEVDTVMVAGKQGPQIFTLEGAEHAYRMLIESMNEGALTLTADAVILYANQCFARMVRRPLEQVLGSSFNSLLSVTDQAVLRPLLKRTAKSGSKIQTFLHAADGTKMPVKISIRLLAKNGFTRAPIGIVVTDMTEAHRAEEMLRSLTHQVVQTQETERRRVALELHDNITQHLCAVLARWQALVSKLPASAKASRGEVLKLSEILGQTVERVQHISRNLRPSILDELGLIPALRATCAEFKTRTGLSFTLACKPLTVRLSSEAELALYRILQKALENVEKHARARHVTVHLTQQGDSVQLTVKDDGIGFDPNKAPSRRKEKRAFGLLRMIERATSVGGTLIVKSAPRAGTEIVARIPLPPGTKAAS